jgi:OmpA-OmpF porin, OOP family
MSVKKYFSLTIAGIATIAATSAIAGAPDVMVPPAPVVDSGFYVEAGAGYGLVHWDALMGGVYNPVQANSLRSLTGFGSVTSAGKGGFIWGGDAGYNFNRHFAFELGAWTLKKVAGNEGMFGHADAAAATNPRSLGEVVTKSWVMYAAAKMSVPVEWVPNLEMFGKVGMGVRFLRYSGSGSGPSVIGVNTPQQLITNQNYAAPVLGAGFQYSFTPEWTVSAQYLYVGGDTVGAAGTSSVSPAAHLITATVGYQFNI